MQTVELNVPEEIFYTLNESMEDFVLRIKLYTAIELFKEHKLSMGKAAELSGMNKVDFMFELGKHEIPVIDYDEDDFREELDKMIVITDSSPLISLAVINKLDLLEKLFKEIFVPSAVFTEVTREEKPFSSILRSFLTV